MECEVDVLLSSLQEQRLGSLWVHDGLAVAVRRIPAHRARSSAWRIGVGWAVNWGVRPSDVATGWRVAGGDHCGRPEPSPVLCQAQPSPWGADVRVAEPILYGQAGSNYQLAFGRYEADRHADWRAFKPRPAPAHSVRCARRTGGIAGGVHPVLGNGRRRRPARSKLRSADDLRWLRTYSSTSLSQPRVGYAPLGLSAKPQPSGRRPRQTRRANAARPGVFFFHGLY